MSNFHAQDNQGRNFKSKKALREAVAEEQAQVANLQPGDAVQRDRLVYFTDTSAFSNRGVITVEDLQPSDMVVGPDPYTARNWYANVKNGKVV